MASQLEQQLIDCIEQELTPFSFLRMSDTQLPIDLGIEAAWRRRTWNTNRAVVVVPFSSLSDHPGRFAQQIKMQVGKGVGYYPFIYPVGLQLVLTGNSLLSYASDMERHVDKIDNQRVVLQSIHLVEIPGKASQSVRTYGQVITGKFQDAIERGIARFAEQR